MPIIPVVPGAIAPPNTPTKTPAGAVDVPNSPSKTAAVGLSVPNTTGKTAAVNLAVPNSPSKTPAVGLSVPNTASKTAAADLVAPNTPTKVDVPAYPRTLIPLVDMHFGSEQYSQNGVSVSFSDLFTYTRGSSATFINRRIVNNKAEYFLDTDFVGTVTNLYEFSEDYSDVLWDKTEITSLLTSEILKTIDGNLNNARANKLTPSAVSNFHSIANLVSVVSGSFYTVSVYVKADGYDFIQLTGSTGFSSSLFQNYDIKRGILVDGNLSGSTSSASIENKGGGWFKCTFTNAATSSTVGNVLILPIDIATRARAASWMGDGIKSVLMTAAQQTVSTKAQPYVKTASSSASDTFVESLPIEYDPVTGENLGVLIEAASTNLVLRSEDIDNFVWAKVIGGSGVNPVVTENATEAPDGTTTADRIVFDTVAGGDNTDFSLISQTSTASSNKTGSFWIKSAVGADQFLKLAISSSSGDQVDITATSVWTRVDTTLATGTLLRIGLRSLAGKADIYLWGGMLEEQPFVTSYIRTEASTVTRSGDLLKANNIDVPAIGESMTQRADFSFSALPAGGSGSSRRVVQQAADSELSFLEVDSAGGDLAARYGGNRVFLAVDGAFSKGTAVWSFNPETNNLKGYFNGALISTVDAGLNFGDDGTMRLGIGSTVAGSGKMFGHIKKYSMYRELLTDQEVALL